MIKLKLECKGCGYQFYADKKQWESLPLVPDEFDCLNPNCQYYGKGLHHSKSAIWIIKETIDTSHGGS